MVATTHCLKPCTVDCASSMFQTHCRMGHPTSYGAKTLQEFLLWFQSTQAFGRLVKAPLHSKPCAPLQALRGTASRLFEQWRVAGSNARGIVLTSKYIVVLAHRFELFAKSTARTEFLTDKHDDGPTGHVVKAIFAEVLCWSISERFSRQSVDTRTSL